jgi:hypothetical protein
MSMLDDRDRLTLEALRGCARKDREIERLRAALKALVELGENISGVRYSKALEMAREALDEQSGDK